MGVGTPCNILEAVHYGIDFFDCVMPSRNARHGNLFTWKGKINLLNEKYAEDARPIAEECGCPACKNYSRSYIRHLIKAKEMLGMRLCVLHNLHFYNDLMAKIRTAIEENRFAQFKAEALEKITHIDAVILLEVTNETVFERLTTRRTTNIQKRFDIISTSSGFASRSMSFSR